MLKRFAVTNFRGFRERIEWDLTKVENYDFHDEYIKGGIIKNGIIYGSNGSGKSNFGIALFDIVKHLTQKMKLDYNRNFTCAYDSYGLVSFEYTFQFGKNCVTYFYIKDAQEKIITELLTLDDLVQIDRTKDSLSIAEFPIDQNVKERFLTNENDVSILNFILSTYPLDKDHYLIQLQDFVNSMLWFRNLNERSFIGLDSTPSKIEEYIIKNDLVRDFNVFLEDVSRQNFQLVSIERPAESIASHVNEESYSILYSIFEGKKPLAIKKFQDIASTGTLALELQYYWYKRMSEASFVFIDEFDAFYHYDLSFNVCKLLFAMKQQVFVSTHNTFLFTNDLLRPDCNFILRENKIQSLPNWTEKELREGHNIEKLYRGGAFDY